jgi:hypothetical protein
MRKPDQFKEALDCFRTTDIGCLGDFKCVLKLMRYDTDPLLDRPERVEPEPQIPVCAFRHNPVNEMPTKLCCARDAGLDVDDDV